jgi:hypothetical protein
MNLLRTILSAWLIGCFAASASADHNTVDVYLFSGQSNMQGSGKIADLPADLPRELPGVFYWNGNAFEPLVIGKTKTGGRAETFGPEIGFAVAVARADHPVYLIKWAASGMPLHHGFNAAKWEGPNPGPNRTTFYPGEKADDPNTGKLYKQMLTHFRAGLAHLEKSGKKPAIRGFLWMQGEADAKNELSATDYGQSLKRLRSRLIEDVKAPADMPMVFGQVLPYEPALDRFTHRKEIRQAMANADAHSGTPAAQPHVKMVSTDGLPLLPDTVHYNAAGLLDLGKSMAKTLEAMAAAGKAGK